jgi:hypothetical protein
MQGRDAQNITLQNFLAGSASEMRNRTLGYMARSKILDITEADSFLMERPMHSVLQAISAGFRKDTAANFFKPIVGQFPLEAGN